MALRWLFIPVLALAVGCFSPKTDPSDPTKDPGAPTPTPDPGVDPTPTPDPNPTPTPDVTPDPEPTPTPDPWACNLGQAPSGFPLTSVGNEVGETLEDFTACLTDSGDLEYHLYRYLGKVVLLNLGAGWCPPCQAEAPDIQELYEDYKDDGFVVIMGMGEGWTQGSDANGSFLDSWAQNYGLTFPIVRDDGWSLSKYYLPPDSGYIPLNIIVDRDGVVLFNGVGGLPVSTAKNLIEGALEQTPSLDYE